MTLFPFALTHSDLAALCFAMHRHGREVLKRDRTPLQRHGLRALDWGALTGVAVHGRRPYGLPIGTVEWLGMLTASAVSFVLLLTFVPRLAAAFAVGLPLCAAATGWLV